MIKSKFLFDFKKITITFQMFSSGGANYGNGSRGHYPGGQIDV